MHNYSDIVLGEMPMRYDDVQYQVREWRPFFPNLPARYEAMRLKYLVEVERYYAVHAHRVGVDVNYRPHDAATPPPPYDVSWVNRSPTGVISSPDVSPPRSRMRLAPDAEDGETRRDCNPPPPPNSDDFDSECCDWASEGMTFSPITYHDSDTLPEAEVIAPPGASQPSAAGVAVMPLEVSRVSVGDRPGTSGTMKASLGKPFDSDESLGAVDPNG